MIKRIVKLTFEPLFIDDFRSIFEQSKQQILAFPGCQHVELLQDTKEEYVFFTFSIWKDETALDHYRHSPFFQTTWAKTKKLFSARPQAWSLTLEDQAK